MTMWSPPATSMTRSPDHRLRNPGARYPASGAPGPSRGESGVRVIREQPGSMQGPAEWFTGAVWFNDLSGGGKVSLGSVHFAPGARTAWHSHPQGQTLYVTEGVARVQDRGGPVEDVRAGETVV